MKNLSRDWFAEGTIDFELKQYHLLAWLQEVRSQFDQARLYPSLSELIFHHENLNRYKESLQSLSGKFPQHISGINPSKNKFNFEQEEKSEGVIAEINGIVDFAIPKILEELEEGKGIYDFIEEQIGIDPIGVLPLYKDAGYFLLKAGNSKKIKAFEYQVSVIFDSGENFRQIQTEPAGAFESSLTQTFEGIKMDLIRKNPKLPNPATFSIVSGLEFPETESLLPVAKRKFFRFLVKEWGQGK